MAVDLNIEPFEKAIASLNEALQAQQAQADDSLIRDACIQRFKYIYEFSHKMLKRFLEMTSAHPDAFYALSFQALIRTGNERGLLKSDWPAWRAYRDARASTSHGYDERKAIEVFKAIPEFLREAIFLRDRLREQISSGAA